MVFVEETSDLPLTASTQEEMSDQPLTATSTQVIDGIYDSITAVQTYTLLEDTHDSDCNM